MPISVTITSRTKYVYKGIVMIINTLKEASSRFFLEDYDSYIANKKWWEVFMTYILGRCLKKCQ